jgi:hypothetical protein
MIMHCLDLKGKELWKFKTYGMVWMRVVFLDRIAYFTSWDCNLYAVNIDTQELVWKFRTEGSPCDISPPHESFELVMKVTEREVSEDSRKTYEFAEPVEEERSTSEYKSEITYQMGTAYRQKGKYQVDEKTEGF